MSLPEKLTNDEVIRMVEAGLSEHTILLKINSSTEREFDTSVDTLIELAKQGIPPSVIDVMVENSY